MAKKPNPKAEMQLVNVHYKDGSQTSNRRVPGHLFQMLDKDEQVMAFIAEQDRDIGERSGRPRGEIDRIDRVR